MDDEIIIPLPNGCTLRCGKGEVYEWGGYLRICDPSGNEIVYWDHHEWSDETEGEQVIGAVFSATTNTVKGLLKSLKKTSVVDGVWI